MSHFTKRYHPPGTAPGTLVASDSAVPLSIRLITYTDTHYAERTFSDLIDSVPLLDAEATTWIDVRGNIQPDVLQQLGQWLNLHDLALEDVLNTGQQAKLEDYDEQLFVVMHRPSLDASGALQLDQVSVFLAPGVLVSFYGQAQDLFGPVCERLRDHRGRLRRHGSDYLLYRLLDLIVDHGFPILEHYGKR
ncbi:CorA family divalent cation transporter [Allochromatium palmeri]|uniref:CorA family divalent cation transporter n=1 Tax=Allochromatium palmeri TaxID=231048 RepID=UPI001FE761F1|nr:CorA family divalent cation transporter [Allochromatium palmeri]